MNKTSQMNDCGHIATYNHFIQFEKNSQKVKNCALYGGFVLQELFVGVALAMLSVVVLGRLSYTLICDQGDSIRRFDAINRARSCIEGFVSAPPSRQGSKTVGSVRLSWQEVPLHEEVHDIFRHAVGLSTRSGISFRLIKLTAHWQSVRGTKESFTLYTGI